MCSTCLTVEVCVHVSRAYSRRCECCCCCCCLLWWSVVEHDNGSGQNKITKQDRIGQDRNRIFVIYCVLRYCGLHGAIFLLLLLLRFVSIRSFLLCYFIRHVYVLFFYLLRKTDDNERQAKRKDKNEYNSRANWHNTFFIIFFLSLFFVLNSFAINGNERE